MFKRKKEPSELDEAITEVFREMKGVTADSTEYAAMADQLSKLYQLRTIDRADKISKDQMATIAAHLGGIAVVVFHERAHIITTKAWTFMKTLL